ncbi:serine hydrolase [Catenovulum sp. SM1970]|uniref:serine hydrolase n=1 Tax=Marinifaba aquimaris TaxID=2741323 RepID=UPI0015743599|nr:serine hydrolase [Marinifaba aquimaris]NTS78067.1 serine hydrolase [Marinifaba aquimaris]
MWCKKKNLILAAIFASQLAACGSDSKKPKIVNKDPEPVVKQSPFTGNWYREGYGEIHKISEQSLSSYYFNQYGCLKTAQISLIDEPDFADDLSLSDDGEQLIYGGSVVMNKRADLPESCETNLLTEAATSRENFEFFWHAFNDYYAFFERRGIDWQAVYDTYSPLVTEQTTSEQLAEILSDIILDFEDAHVSLTGNGELEFEVFGQKLSGMNAELMRMGVSTENFEQYREQLKESHQSAAIGYLIPESIKQDPDSDQIIWGKINNEVGYFAIDRMMGLSRTELEKGNLDYASDVALVERVMPQVLSDFEDTKAIIVDVRFNDGGFDSLSLAIAGYFTNQDKVVGSKYYDNSQGQGTPEVIEIKSQPNAYSKPIYLVAGQETYSAGEVFTLAMSALEHVNYLGEPTQGIFSDIQDVIMPNGWEIGLSNEVYLGAQGEKLEAIGVIPDVHLPLYSFRDLHFSQDTIIEYVLNDTDTNTHLTISKNEMEQEIEQVMQQANIPGLAISVVTPTEVIYQQGFGYADIENQIPVTKDTAFTLGSTTKGVVGTAIAKLIEQDRLSLDMPLADMNLPFYVINPSYPEQTLTLNHLVTHTSWIIDSNSYLCNYYTLEGHLSLLELLMGEGQCDNAVYTELEPFLTAYFTPGSDLYRAENFYQSSDFEFGQRQVYTNVGAGLAAYSVEQALNIDMAAYIEQSLFLPLDMMNSSFDPNYFNQQGRVLSLRYDQDKELINYELPAYSYPTVYDGALMSSTADLAKLMLMLVNDGEYNGVQILEEETVESMFSSKTDAYTEVSTQGLFWVTTGSFIGHSGGDPGVFTYFDYNPHTEVGIILQINVTDDYQGHEKMEEYGNEIAGLAYRYGLAESRK